MAQIKRLFNKPLNECNLEERYARVDYFLDAFVADNERFEAAVESFGESQRKWLRLILVGYGDVEGAVRRLDGNGGKPIDAEVIFKEGRLFRDNV